jgi:hypothetical protein
VVAGDRPVLPGFRDVFAQLAVEFDLGQHCQEDLDWDFDFLLHQHPDGVVHATAAYFLAVVLLEEGPGLFVDLLGKTQHFLVLFFEIGDKG